MKRRSFLRALFGLPALPVVAKELVTQAELAAITPSNDELLRLARKHPAPKLEDFTPALNAQSPTWTTSSATYVKFDISPTANWRQGRSVWVSE